MKVSLHFKLWTEIDEFITMPWRDLSEKEEASYILVNELIWAIEEWAAIRIESYKKHLKITFLFEVYEGFTKECIIYLRAEEMYEVVSTDP